VVSFSGGITLTFGHISSPGQTTLDITNTGPPPDSTFRIFPSNPPVYYDFSTSAVFSDSITICFPYNPASLTPKQEARLKVQHFVGPGWEDVTHSLDTAANIICSRTAGLSVFTLGTELECSNELLGDLNGDSLHTPSDVVLMLNCVFLGIGNCHNCYTDVNCDGILSPSDVVFELIKVFLASSFPC
jgi:hypothetical protein